MKQPKWIETISDPTEFFESQVVLTEVNFQDNELRDMQTREVVSKSVRTISDQRVGTCRGGYSDTPEDMYRTARRLSKYGRRAAFDLPSHSVAIQDETIDTSGLDQLDTEKMIDLGNRILRKLTDALPDWTIHINLRLSSGTKHLRNSNGIDYRFGTKAFNISITLGFAETGNIIEIFNGREFFPDTADLEQLISETVEYATLSMKTADLPEGKYPVLVHPVALTSFFDSLGQAVNGKMIFEGLSPLKDKLFQNVCDSSVSIFDDPFAEHAVRFSSVSDEGVPVKRRPIIESGELKMFMTDLDYAARLGVEPSGHGVKLDGFPSGDSVLADPMISPTNIIMNPGDTPLKQLLESIRSGVLLVQTWDVWSGTLINGDVSGSIHLGFRIEDGKLTGRVKDMRVSGNIYRFLGAQLAGMSRERPVTLVGSVQLPYLLFNDVSIT